MKSNFFQIVSMKDKYFLHIINVDRKVVGHYKTIIHQEVLRDGYH
jgi:hypothetical protein